MNFCMFDFIFMVSSLVGFLLKRLARVRWNGENLLSAPKFIAILFCIYLSIIRVIPICIAVKICGHSEYETLFSLARKGIFLYRKQLNLATECKQMH